MKPCLTLLAVWLVVLPVLGVAHAGSGSSDVKQGCFFEADFLAKRIAGDTREARAAEARRWYVRRLVRETLAAHRQATAMTPLPQTFPGS
jgi:hypothetical protein